MEEEKEKEKECRAKQKALQGRLRFLLFLLSPVSHILARPFSPTSVTLLLRRTAEVCKAEWTNASVDTDQVVLPSNLGQVS